MSLPEPVGTASGLFVDGAGRVLMGLRAAWKAAWPSTWDAIGGRIEPGETPEQAMVREAGEEIGVTPTAWTRLAAVPESRPDLHGAMIHHIFAVTAWDGEVVNCCDEHDDLRWFTPDELAALSNLAGFGYVALARAAVALA